MKHVVHVLIACLLGCGSRTGFESGGGAGGAHFFGDFDEHGVVDEGEGLEGGAGGGRVLVAGTPETVAACAASHTGRFLAPVLQRARD